MGNIFDYLTWRGDLTFTQDPPNAVDALIFSTLTYVDYGEKAARDPDTAVTLRECTEEFFSLEDPEGRARSKKDVELLRRAAETVRFGQCRLCLFQSRFLPEQETQFAAMTFLPDDGTMFLAYRGTDNSLVGWKEDFNMTFQQTIPAQRLAQEYIRQAALAYTAPMRVAGHSKGGNLAVFAAARRSVFHIRVKDLPIFFGTGVVSVLSLAWCYFSCQQECSLAVAGILLYLAPSIVVLFSAVLWKEPLTGRKITALLLALVGCALVSGIAGGSLTVTVRGLLLGIGAGFSYAMYTVFAHYGLRKYDSYTVIYWTFVFAGIGSLAFLNWTELQAALPDGRTWLYMAGLVVIATVLPYLFYTKGLEGTEEGMASIMSNVEPVVAAVSGAVLLGEKPDLWTAAGIVCVLGSVILLAGGKKSGSEQRA